MAQVTITINERIYKMACDDGQEKHLLGLAEHLNKHVAHMLNNFGQVGDTRLLVMAGVTVVDELREAERKIEALEAELDEMKNARDSLSENLEAIQGSIAGTLDD
ncbi:MAG: cell division protein ZapA, partial [Fimbriimonadaceae bacterium]|nr:cell division protein ZapA [Alphaproteobacteria bacterium]